MLPLTVLVDPGLVVFPPATPDECPVGEPLGVLVGDELGVDDGLWSAVGDGLGLPDRVPLFGLAVLDGLPQLVGVGVAAALLLALAVVEAETDGSVVPVGVAVADELGLALLLGGVCGLVLGLWLGLPLPLGGGGEELAGVVDGSPDWLGWVDLGGAGVPAPVGLGEVRQDEPGVGVRFPRLALVKPAPPPPGWPGADPGVLAELVVPEPVTVAVSWPIE